MASLTTLIKNATTIPGKGIDLTTFDDVADAKGGAIAAIKAITVYAQAVVTGLQVDYFLADGSVYSAPLRGKADGAKAVIALGADEALVEIAAKSTADGMVALSFGVTSEAGKAKVYGPFGKDPSPAKDGDDDPDLHDLVTGGSNDQGFSFFGSRVAALCGEMTAGRPVGLAAYTMPIVDPGDGVSTSSVISEDFRQNAKGDVETFSNYRNIVTLPHGTASVDLWAEEELSVSIAGTAYKLDPVKKTTVAPNALGKLVIDIEGSDVSIPALKLKTDSMTGHFQWCTLYPDAPAHAKIAGLDADALHNNRAKLGIDAKYSKDDCAHVQAAVTTLAKASASRAAGPASMDHPNWVLDLRSGSAKFTPLTTAEAQAINAAAKTTTDHKQSFGSFVHKATHVVVHTADSTVKTVASGATSAAKDTAKETVKIADDTAKNAEKVVADAKKVASDFDKASKDLGGDLAKGDFKDFGKDFVTDGLQLGLDVAATGFDVWVTIHTPEGEALVYALDHCGKYGKLIGGILTAIAVRVEALVEFIRDLHDWKSFLVVQKALLDAMESSIQGTVNTLETSKAAALASFDKTFDTVKAKANDGIDKAIRSLGGVTGDGKIKAPKDLAKDAATAKTEVSKAIEELLKIASWPMEKLDWLLSKVMDHLPGAAAIEKFFSTLAALAGDLGSEIVKLLEPVGADLGESVVKMVDDIRAMSRRPQAAPELLLCAILQLVEGLLDVSLDVAKGVIHVGVDVGLTLLTEALKWLKGTMEIPFISKLYKSLTGENLSLLGLVAWLLAVPTTLIHVAIYGRAPSLAAHAQSDVPEDWSHISTIAAGASKAASSLLVAILDVKALMAQSAEIRRATTVAMEDGQSAADATPTKVDTADDLPWVELMSWLVDVIGQFCSIPFPKTWTQGAQNDVSNVAWIWAWGGIGIDLWSLVGNKYLGSGGRHVRLARAFDETQRRGPIIATLVSLSELAWNVGLAWGWPNSDPHPALAISSSLVGPAAGALEGFFLWADRTSVWYGAAGVGLFDAGMGAVEGYLTITLGTKKHV